MFVVFHTSEPHYDKRYFKTVSGAKRSQTCSNRNAGCYAYHMMSEEEFDKFYPVGMKVVKNLMTGQDIKIPEDTPHCCDPSGETYWSM